jgi:hypothetical protein
MSESKTDLVISKLITNNLPVLKHKFTKQTYLYLGAVFFLVNYVLYKRGYYVMMVFIALGIYGLLLLRENDRILVEEEADFEKLEEKMKVLLNDKMVKKNFLYVDLNLLDFLYNIRNFRMKSLKYFNDTLRNVNEFLEVVEVIKEKNRPTTENLQRLSSTKKQALNSFHSIVFRITSIVEIQKHNEFRYILEEKLNNIFLECLEMAKGHINLNTFAHDTTFNKYYDVY